jgi:hypothetical protein
VLTALCGFLAGACVTDPDVVATRTLEAGSDGRFMTDARRCVAGLYTGSFNHTTVEDGRSSFPVSGDIAFRMVAIEVGGSEFLVVQSGGKLTGKPVQGSRISADIDANVDGGSGGCSDGHFRVDLVNGEFYQSDASTPIRFTGIVEGTYEADTEQFTGEWRAFLEGTTIQVSQGRWQALRRPD